MNERPAIRTVFWDYGNVLWTHHSNLLWPEVGRLATPRRSAHEALAMVRRAGLVQLYDGGDIATGEFVERMNALFHFEDISRFVHFWRSRALSPNADMWRVVAELRRREIPQAVISNINEVQADKIENSLGCGMVMQLFPRIYSYRVRLLKPDPRIYTVALDITSKARQLNRPLRPEECVLIDDRPENIASFGEFGGIGVLHNPLVQAATFECLAELDLIPWTQLP